MKRYYKKNDKNRFVRCLTATLCLCLLLGILFVLKSTNNAVEVKANERLSDLQYKVVQIDSGDSLWSIAKENMNPGFSDIYEYIDEIKECNQLTSDIITSGNYLMIPYYEIEAAQPVIVSANK